jgi:hypothetical protein
MQTPNHLRFISKLSIPRSVLFTHQMRQLYDLALCRLILQRALFFYCLLRVQRAFKRYLFILLAQLSANTRKLIADWRVFISWSLPDRAMVHDTFFKDQVWRWDRRSWSEGKFKEPRGRFCLKHMSRLHVIEHVLVSLDETLWVLLAM